MSVSLKRLAALAATALALTLGGLSTAASAEAATTVAGGTSAALSETQPVPAPPDSLNTICPHTWFCVWHGPPRPGGWLGGRGQDTCYTPFNNDGNAVSNQTGFTIRVWSETGCRGSFFDLSTGHFSYPTPFIVRSVTTGG